MSKQVDWEAIKAQVLTIMRGKYPRAIVSCNEVAAFMPYPHSSVKYAMKYLAQRGKIISKRGPGGGYILRTR